NEFQTYSAVLKRAGLKPQQFERYRPWLAAVVVGLAYLHGGNLDSLRGADDDLMDYARAHGRPLAYLESVRDQMSLLVSGEESDHIKALKSLILGLPRSRNQESELLAGWAAGDAEGFAARLATYFRGHAEAEELLIDARNRNWLPAIEDFLARPAGGTAMITVGAAHVGGPKGLIALLCHDGYPVERVRERNAGENACGTES
ncbi:MAG TPA: TraB/GumN family protein, partial [Micropepsaceae bacterium]